MPALVAFGQINCGGGLGKGLDPLIAYAYYFWSLPMGYDPLLVHNDHILPALYVGGLRSKFYRHTSIIKCH